MSGFRSPLALLAITLGLLAGCGRMTRVPVGGTLQVAVTEYRVVPQSVSMAPGTVTILVHNYGRLSHNLVISLDGQSRFSTQPIPPGQTTALYATLMLGRYQIASTILADQALGTYGTLTVK